MLLLLHTPADPHSAQERFGITLDPVRITFAGLASRDKLKDDYYKRARLLRQSIAGAWLAYEGLRDGMVPDMWIGASASPDPHAPQ